MLAARTTVQSIPSAWTLINFNAADIFDTDTLHDPATNNSRLTAAIAGKYLATFQAYMSAGSPETTFGYAILKNSGGTFTASKIIGFSQAVNASAFTAPALIDLAAGDHLEAWVFQNSGSNLNLNAATVPALFGMVYLGE